MTRPSATLLWIDAGATIFLVALLVSRLLVPDLRARHFFQAAIYIAVVLLAHRGSAWGFGAGFAICMVWNAFSLLVTHLMQAGLGLWALLHAGHGDGPVRQFLLVMVALGGAGHFVLIIATFIACLQ